MPYLPRRRFRPAGIRTGRRTPTSLSPSIDYTMPAWLRRALAKGRDGLAEAPPPTPRRQYSANYRPTPSPAVTADTPPSVEYDDSYDVPLPPTGPSVVQGGQSFLEQLFGNLFQGQSNDLGAVRREQSQNFLGPIQDFVGDIAFGDTLPNLGEGFRTAGRDFLGFLAGAGPGPGGLGPSTESFERSFDEIFPQGGGGEGFLGLGDLFSNLSASVAGEDGRDNLTNIMGIDVAPGSGGAPPGTGEWLMRSFAQQDLDALYDYYAGLAAPPPAFQGAGGGGGFGGFNFPESEPADPRFWTDMVRWLIP